MMTEVVKMTLVHVAENVIGLHNLLKKGYFNYDVSSKELKLRLMSPLNSVYMIHLINLSKDPSDALRHYSFKLVKDLYILNAVIGNLEKTITKMSRC